MLFEKTDGMTFRGHTRNEIVDRISDLMVDCPECETIIHDDDEQYHCMTCEGARRINVLDWMASEVMALLPTEKDADEYANGAFGYERDSYDREQAFLSGVDWMRCKIAEKLTDN